MIAPVRKVPTGKKSPKALRLLKVASRPGGIEKLLAVRRGKGYEPARSDPVAAAGRLFYGQTGTMPGRMVISRLEKLPRNLAELEAKKLALQKKLGKLRDEKTFFDDAERLYADYGDDIAALTKRYLRTVGIEDPDKIPIGQSGGYQLGGRVLDRRMHPAGILENCNALIQLINEDGRYLDANKNPVIDHLRFMLKGKGTVRESTGSVAHIINNYRFITGLKTNETRVAPPKLSQTIQTLERAAGNMDSLSRRLSRNLPKDGQFGPEHLVELYTLRYGPFRGGRFSGHKLTYGRVDEPKTPSTN